MCVCVCTENPNNASAPEDPCDGAGARQNERLLPRLIGGSHLARHLTAAECGCVALLTGHVMGGRDRQAHTLYGLIALQERR